MANLPSETLNLITNLLPRLFEVINLATATEFNLFEQYGETDETVYELEQIKNAIERVRTSYNRLYGLTLQVAESQPFASPATLELLRLSIEQTQATADAVAATALLNKKNVEFTMNIERKIPDAATRVRNVERWKEVCLMLDHLNMMLEQASAIAQADLQNSPLYVHRRERVRKQLAMYQVTKNPNNSL